MGKRFHDLILSIYIFNEKRGYTYLDKLVAAFEKKFPGEAEILASIKKHAADERVHFHLFDAYFRSLGRPPYQVSAWVGYCDQIVSLIFGKTIDQLDPHTLVENEQHLFKLCRLIMITETRGMAQVEAVLNSRLVVGNDPLRQIFQRIKKDEPSHCYPYRSWLRKNKVAEVSLGEKIADSFTHFSLICVKIPLLFLNPFLRRGVASG